MKYGGSSVATVDLLRQAAQQVASARAEHAQVVAVVSAMGDQTNQLYDLVYSASVRPARRELDVITSTGELVSSALLAILLNDLGTPARSLSGAQAGIRTNELHGNARIEDIDTSFLSEIIASGEVAVVAGFQGVNPAGEVTTLGRGGSDTTAAALAVALEASECRIYTDVPGVLTTDPRICPKARVIPSIHFEEMLELAALGARVLHPRAVEFAGRNRLKLRVLAAAAPGLGGTTITFDSEENMERPNVTGIAFNQEEAKITVRNVPDRPGVAARLFSQIAARHIDVDLIVQNIAANGHTDITFTVHRSQSDNAVAALTEIAAELGCEDVECALDVGKVSLVGIGMSGHAGIAAQMFEVLAEAKVNIQMISTSEIKTSVLIEEDKIELAVRKLHKHFGLDAVEEVGAVSASQAK